jgi:tetratricopeptide (TPR) repeat protein
VVLLAALLAFQTAWFLPAVSRTDWRAVAGQIARRADPGDVVLVKGVPMWGVDTLVGNKPGPLPRVVAAHTLESVCNKAEALLAGRLSDTGLRERPDRVWVVFEMAFYGPEEVARTLRERLAPGGTRVETAYYPGMMGVSLLELSREVGGVSASASAGPAKSFTDYDRLMEAAHTPPDARGPELDALRAVMDLPTGLGAHDFWVLSVLLSEEGRFDAAARFARAALSASRDYPPACLALGVALCGAGQKEEGRRTLDRALALDPAYGRLYGRLFSSCLETPDQAAARAELARLAPLGPPYMALADMARRIFPGMDPPSPGMP